MPTHNHAGSASNVNLTGVLTPYAANQTDATFSTSGIVSNTAINGKNVENTGNSTNAKTINFNASHGHTITVNSTGGGNAHNNIQPYVSVFIWLRTA